MMLNPRCHHRNDDKCTHEDNDGCDQYLSPCLTQSKVGAVLHLGHVLSDGSVHYVDMDLNCPTFKTSDVDSYDGSDNDYREYLMRALPLFWLDERYKQEIMTSVNSVNSIRSVRVKRVNWRNVLPSKVISAIKLILNVEMFSHFM